ncbi:MAG: FHA domain-containing protein, partial [Planctomycetes bacterium]|nr:FHA domain-containing protein [Planctomycetota bacterium]
MARLILESGKEPLEYPLGDLTRLGREPGNEIVVNDGAASRRHAEVARDGDGYVLKDLKSANGTYRNDERIDTVKLAEGDRIKIGAVVLRFTTEASSAGSSSGGGAPAKDTRFALVFTGGERAGDKLVVKEGRTTFGRKPGNTVTVKDPKVSGVHCEIVFEDGHPTLRDLGSTNGTYLEGKKVEEVPLSHGDRVLVGDLDFVFTDTSRPLPESLGKGPAVAAAQTLVDVPQ